MKFGTKEISRPVPQFARNMLTRVGRRECKHTDKITYNPGMATPAVFQIPPLQKRKRIPMTTIRAIANHIAKKFDPEQIILFGSHAYGKPTAWSDVDLLGG